MIKYDSVCSTALATPGLIINENVLTRLPFLREEGLKCSLQEAPAPTERKLQDCKIVDTRHLDTGEASIVLV